MFTCMQPAKVRANTSAIAELHFSARRMADLSFDMSQTVGHFQVHVHISGESAGHAQLS